MSLKGRSCWDVNIRMHDAEKLSLEAMGRFVEASEKIRFEGENRRQLYGWVEQVLVGQQYAQLGKAARGLVRRYIEKMTRLIARYTATGRVQATVYRRRRFAQLYTGADIELLASVDEAHETLSGPATRRILEREFEVYKRPEYARLAAISVAHLYNLREHPTLGLRQIASQTFEALPENGSGPPVHELFSIQTPSLFFFAMRLLEYGSSSRFPKVFPKVQAYRSGSNLHISHADC